VIFTAIDLELNKNEENTHTTDIIQLGSCTGNVYTGEILETNSFFVKIDKPLIPYIEQLTHITDYKLQSKGTTLLEAYNKLKAVHQKYEAKTSLITWGSGDHLELKKQLIAQGMKEEDWAFGYRCLDTKTLVQSIQLANKSSMQGGLKKGCARFGVTFPHPAHDAANDAKATFLLYVELLKRLK